MKCDNCNSVLEYERLVDILDMYDDKILVQEQYYCNSCSAECRHNEEYSIKSKESQYKNEIEEYLKYNNIYISK